MRVFNNADEKHLESNMLIRFFSIITVVFLFSSCTVLKQFGSAINRKTVVSPASAIANNQASSVSDSEVKFLNEISASAQPPVTQVSSIQSNNPAEPIFASKIANVESFISENSDVKGITVPVPLQLKYAALLGTNTIEIQHLNLFEFIDDWYGTRYRMGGTTKKGIDCSALVQFLFSEIYDITVPRTSKEQYKQTHRISLTELQEGDLLFFHTRGRGVSHVGVYLQNNKFFHASSSGGVMISDMYESYFVKRFIAAGRVEK